VRRLILCGKRLCIIICIDESSVISVGSGGRLVFRCESLEDKMRAIAQIVREWAQLEPDPVEAVKVSMGMKVKDLL